MARANVYLPEQLAREWRTAGTMNLSQLTQIAIRRELARTNTDLWLERVAVLREWDVSHEEVLRALLEDAATSGGGP
jgi:post-segregation antitoxin (ccd killing protein)